MPGILAGYARTSTSGQQAGMDAQNRDLEAAGCEEIFSEQISAVASRIGSRNFLGRELGRWVTSPTPKSEPPLRVTGAASVRLKERHSMAGLAPETSRSTHCHYLNEASPSHPCGQIPPQAPDRMRLAAIFAGPVRHYTTRTMAASAGRRPRTAIPGGADGLRHRLCRIGRAFPRGIPELPPIAREPGHYAPAPGPVPSGTGRETQASGASHAGS